MAVFAERLVEQARTFSRAALVRQFVIYFFIAGISALVDLFLIYMFTDMLGIHYLISVGLSFPVAVYVNFALNKYLNFRKKGKHLMQMGIFFLVNLGGITITVILMYLFVEYFLIWYIFARIMTYFVTLVYSFTLHKYVTFR